jgi:pilus assembly protein Flp/PilA
MLTSTFNHTIWVLDRVRAAIRHRVSDERGATLVEYALLFALIVLVCIGAVTVLGSATSDSVTHSADSVAVAN